MTESDSTPAPAASSSPYGVAPDARPRNVIGVAAFIAGVASKLVGVIFGLSVPAILAADGAYGVYQLASFITSVLGFVLGAVALVLGIVGLVRPGRPRGFAAAGAAIGAVVVVEVAVGLLQGLVYAVL
ncbi:hypothetical protein FLP10_09305 [Agromyces intestinalis]|uniref:Uncharacterized protein n=1 Tax=Agromyces intestinalis TaxID=2592652 RepID=A0A5C1YEX5_9MICO|nr:hypothetical protein [Agromyces intestinalis]QEO14594.1 hypothetical protein FLP10_09305 [Agromyces intestinalis]